MEAAKKNIQTIDTRTEVSLQEKAFLVRGTKKIPIHAESASRFSLFFRYLEDPTCINSDKPLRLIINKNGQTVELGPCRILSNGDRNGNTGRLVFTNDVFDVECLINKNQVKKLQSPFSDLPLLLARKDKVRQSFKEYTANLRYDLQVYKSLFDSLDSKYRDEPEEVKEAVQEAIIKTKGPDFISFFEDKLDELKYLVDDFSPEEHRCHGYYFRKQLWDLILCCPFSGRSALKPRGYPGDSGLMRMIYLNNYQGESTYAKLVHKHGVGHAAGQSVRDRLLLAGRMLNNYQKRTHLSRRGKVKVLSVGSGAAFELQDIIKSPQDCGKYHFALFDQDPVALSEAAEIVNSIENSLGPAPEVDYVQGSVRTMLFSRKLRQEWGQFDFIYALGIFDYLTTRVAKAVLDRLCELIEPRGELVIGNYHVSNPSKYFMGYWGDWFLIHRTEEEFTGLIEDNPEYKTSLHYDETGSQMFLHIQKQAFR
jgi:extracellular factor (EF) 3-hydroxypalmitic acid methyl ester biosynthesis protein